MSMENVDLFYKRLDEDPVLRERALSLQKIYKEQEDVLDAFLALAKESGLPFTQEEFIMVMYRRAMAQDEQEKH